MYDVVRHATPFGLWGGCPVRILFARHPGHFTACFLFHVIILYRDYIKVHRYILVPILESPMHVIEAITS